MEELFDPLDPLESLILPVTKIGCRKRAGVLGGFAGKPPHYAAGIFPKLSSSTFIALYWT